MNIILFIIGVVWVTYGLILTASGGIKGKIVFNIIPFFSGLYVMWYSARIIGWI